MTKPMQDRFVKMFILLFSLFFSFHLAHASRALIDAAENGDLAQVTRLIADHDNVNDMEEEIGWTALMLAGGNGHIDVVNALLARPEILINHTHNSGLTALMHAANTGRIDVVHALLARPEILINHAEYSGSNALMAAAMNGYVRIISRKTRFLTSETPVIFPRIVFNATRALRWVGQFRPDCPGPNVNSSKSWCIRAKKAAFK